MVGSKVYVAIATLLCLTAACAGLAPVRKPMELRLEGDSNARGVLSMQQLCEPGLCYVGEEVYLDERDVRGAALQDGEVQASLVLEFTETGARKLRLVTRSNAGRRLAIVQDGKVLVMTLIRGEILGGKAEVAGRSADLRRVFESLTAPPPPAP